MNLHVTLLENGTDCNGLNIEKLLHQEQPCCSPTAECPPLHTLRGWDRMMRREHLRSSRSWPNYQTENNIFNSRIFYVVPGNKCLFRHFRFTTEPSKPITHYKLTRRRRTNSIGITVETLWPRCSSSSNFTHKSKKSQFIRLHNTNLKHFCSFQ